MKFEMKKPIFECPYCHEKIEGDYAAYQEHVQVCYEKDMARQKLKNEKEIRLKKLNEDAKSLKRIIIANLYIPAMSMIRFVCFDRLWHSV